MNDYRSWESSYGTVLGKEDAYLIYSHMLMAFAYCHLGRSYTHPSNTPADRNEIRRAATKEFMFQRQKYFWRENEARRPLPF